MMETFIKLVKVKKNVYDLFNLLNADKDNIIL